MQLSGRDQAFLLSHLKWGVSGVGIKSGRREFRLRSNVDI